MYVPEKRLEHWMTCVNIQLSSQKYFQKRLVSENYLEKVKIWLDTKKLDHNKRDK